MAYSGEAGTRGGFYGCYQVEFDIHGRRCIIMCKDVRYPSPHNVVLNLSLEGVKSLERYYNGLFPLNTIRQVASDEHLVSVPSDIVVNVNSSPHIDAYDRHVLSNRHLSIRQDQAKDFEIQKQIREAIQSKPNLAQFSKTETKKETKKDTSEDFILLIRSRH